MRFTYFIFLLFILTFFGCRDSQWQVSRIEGKQIPISDTISEDPEVKAFIKPFSEGINNDLDSALAYSVATFSKRDGTFNTALGNMMADAVYEQANPIFKRQYGAEIDMVLLNHGGIRALIPEGPVSKRTAYKLMPFENIIVVVKLKGAAMTDLLNYLLNQKTAHPISRLKLRMDANFKLIEAKINENPIDQNKTYYVATYDYLLHNGDHMGFFKQNEGTYFLNYKVRNALIDYFIKKDTINPVIDDRFIQVN